MPHGFRGPACAAAAGDEDRCGDGAQNDTARTSDDHWLPLGVQRVRNALTWLGSMVRALEKEPSLVAVRRAPSDFKTTRAGIPLVWRLTYWPARSRLWLNWPTSSAPTRKSFCSSGSTCTERNITSRALQSGHQLAPKSISISRLSFAAAARAALMSAFALRVASYPSGRA